MSTMRDLDHRLSMVYQALTRIDEKLEIVMDEQATSELDDLVQGCYDLLEYVEKTVEDLDSADDEDVFPCEDCDEKTYLVGSERYTPHGMVDEILEWRDIVAQLLNVPIAYVDIQFVRANLPNGYA